MEEKKTKRVIINLSVFCYFFFMLLANQVSNYAVFIIFYASLVLCGFAGLYADNFRIRLYKIVFIFLICCTGIINYVYVGNNTINNLVFTVVFFFTSFALTSNYLDEKTPLIAIWMNVGVVLFKFLTVGFWGQIYTSSASNFVSVYLMYPTVVYYSVVSKKGKKVDMIPAVAVWILSLLSRGRGGIISSSAFLLIMFFIQYHGSRSIKKMALTTAIIILVGIVMLNLERIIAKLNASVIMEYFIARQGLKSSRLGFWREYIELAVSNIKGFMLGADLSKIGIGIELENNPHNSLLEIHVLNGIGGLVICLFMIIRNMKKGLKCKNYIYLACLMFALIRGFTDHVLWGAFGTPVFFYLLFYFENIKMPNKTDLFSSLLITRRTVS